jgi:hypothetical protein
MALEVIARDRRQKTLRGVDGGLNFLLCDIDVQGQIKLQHNDGGATGTGGGHLAQALQFAELTLQGRGHRGGHDGGAGSGIEGEHLNGGVVDLGQGRDRELAIADDANQKDGDHQQRGRYRP